jgi:hypothetical protein
MKQTDIKKQLDDLVNNGYLQSEEGILYTKQYPLGPVSTWYRVPAERIES